MNRPESFFRVCVISLFAFSLTLSAQENIQIPATPDAVQPSTDEASLQSLSLDDLRSKLLATEAAIPELGKKSQELEGELRELRIASYSNEAVVAIQEQIELLKKQINEAIDKIPEVAAKKTEVETSKKAFFDEMQLRTEIMALIAQREKEASDLNK